MLCPGSVVVLDCIDFWSLPSYLLYFISLQLVIGTVNLPGIHYSVDFLFLFCLFCMMDSIVEFETIRGSLMTPKCRKPASLAQKTYILYTFSSLVYYLFPDDNRFRTYLTSFHYVQLVIGTVGLHGIYYSVDFLFLFVLYFCIMHSIVEFETFRESLVVPKCLAQVILSVLWCILGFQMISVLKHI